MIPILAFVGTAALFSALLNAEWMPWGLSLAVLCFAATMWLT